jgi:hypothetical protein
MIRSASTQRRACLTLRTALQVDCQLRQVTAGPEHRIPQTGGRRKGKGGREHINIPESAVTPGSGLSSLLSSFHIPSLCAAVVTCPVPVRYPKTALQRRPYSFRSKRVSSVDDKRQHSPAATNHSDSNVSAFPHHKYKSVTMVLSARSAALFSSRSPSLLTSVSRARPWRAAFHTRASASGLPGRAPFNASKFGPLISQRLLTTRREKVKVLAVLYDGGEHAQQVRT